MSMKTELESSVDSNYTQHYSIVKAKNWQLYLEPSRYGLKLMGRATDLTIYKKVPS